MTATPASSNSRPLQRFPVVVVGAGPAGLTVGCVLRAAGVDCLVLETGTRESVEQRPRAGVIEEPVVRGLERRGLAGNLLERARRDTACEFRFDGERHPFGYHELTGGHHWVYPQQFLVTDLVREYADVRGGACGSGCGTCGCTTWTGTGRRCRTSARRAATGKSSGVTSSRGATARAG